MANMTQEQQDWLETFFAQCESNESKLSTWEQGFVRDQKERFEKYEGSMYLSQKQWMILNRIDAKINGEA